MPRQNEWTHATAKLSLPPLPDEMKGKSGCRLHEATIDPEIGKEVMLVIREDKEFVGVLHEARPFQLFCKHGIARTSHGLVVIVLAIIRDSVQTIAAYEIYFDPHGSTTKHLITSWADQTHLKVILFDHENDRVVDWFEFENDFGMAEFCSTFKEMTTNEPPGNFELAKQEFSRDYSLEDLMEI